MYSWALEECPREQEFKALSSVVKEKSHLSPLRIKKGSSHPNCNGTVGRGRTGQLVGRVFTAAGVSQSVDKGWNDGTWGMAPAVDQLKPFCPYCFACAILAFQKAIGKKVTAIGGQFVS